MDPLRTTILVLLVLSAALAGCIGGDDVDPEAKKPGPEDPNAPPTPEDGKPFKYASTTALEAFFEAIELVPADDPEFSRPNITSRDWILMSLPVTPEGAVHGFAWQIPQGGLVASDGGFNLLIVDVAVALGPMGVPAGLPPGVDWAIALFHQTKDESGNTGVRAGDHMFGVTKEISVDGGSAQTEAARSHPFSLRIAGDDLNEGDTVWFVLAARGSTGGEFAVGARMLGQAYMSLGNNQGDSADWEDFHSAVNFRTPFVPARKVTSQGLHLAWYLESHRMAESSYQEASADAGVDDVLPTDLYPHATFRDLTLSSSSPGGWSAAHGSYLSGGELGNWEINVDLHGQSLGDSGPFANTAFFGDLLSGRSDGVGFSGVAAGSSGATIDFNLMKLGTIPVGEESLALVHVNIGIDVAELTGLPHLNRLVSYGGILED